MGITSASDSFHVALQEASEGLHLVSKERHGPTCSGGDNRVDML